jgi:hypothetical protein
MESGKHRMSLKLIKGEGIRRLYHFFGLVRDGAAWDKYHSARASTDAWYMNSYGDLYGNGKCYDDAAGSINDGQIVSMAGSRLGQRYTPILARWQAAWLWLQ